MKEVSITLSVESMERITIDTLRYYHDLTQKDMERAAENFDMAHEQENMRNAMVIQVAIERLLDFFGESLYD